MADQTVHLVELIDYCDYCDVFLTHDSSSVRKAHNSGRNHLTNVKDYYSSLGHDKAQDLIDQITKMYESGGQPKNQPFPQQPNFMMGGNMPPQMMGGGMPPMRFGGGPQSQMPPHMMQQGFNPQQQQQQQPQQQQQQFPPAGFRPPPGMPMPPPGFAMPPGMSGPPQGGPSFVATGGPELPRLVQGMNPERARALGLM